MSAHTLRFDENGAIFFAIFRWLHDVLSKLIGKAPLRHLATMPMICLNSNLFASFSCAVVAMSCDLSLLHSFSPTFLKNHLNIGK
jgi:hypothetical protein